MARKKSAKPSDPAGAKQATSPSKPKRKNAKPHAAKPDGSPPAGGLEALTGLLERVPADSGLALVVVSRLDPEHKSALGEILVRTCKMPVLEVLGHFAPAGLKSENRTVTLGVRDDGQGLPGEGGEEKGMGLKTMRYRAGLIDAALSVVTAKPAGALVSCTVHYGESNGPQPNHDA